MADSFLSNLASNWGLQPEEVDPTKLDGLIQMAEQALDQGVEKFLELRAHFDHLHGQALRHINELETLASGPGSAPEPVMDAAAATVESFQDLEEVLVGILALTAASSSDECFEALGVLEEASESVRECCQELARVTSG